MKRDWFPRSRAQQLVMFTNVNAKIADYKSDLPITGDQIAKIQLICQTFIAVCNFVEQARASMQNVTDWQADIFNSKNVAPVPKTPAFMPAALPAEAKTGIFQEFRRLIDLIKASPGYTEGIGEDLMIVGAEISRPPEDSVAPDLKVSTAGGYVVQLRGSMKGFNAMRVEYRKKGNSAWQHVAFMTKLPGDFKMTPAAPGEPESGEIGARFIDKNQDVGEFSPSYSITVS